MPMADTLAVLRHCKGSHGYNQASRPSDRAQGSFPVLGHSLVKVSSPCSLYITESSLPYTYPREPAFLTGLSSDPHLIIYSRKDPSDDSPGWRPCAGSWSYAWQAIDLTATCLGFPSVPCIRGPQAFCACRPGKELLLTILARRWLQATLNTPHPGSLPPKLQGALPPKGGRKTGRGGGKQAGHKQRDE